MTEALVSMRVAAAARGVHYDTFRKGWQAWVRDEGFPAPVADRRPYLWRPSSLAAWQARAEAATLAALLKVATDPGVPANQNSLVGVHVWPFPDVVVKAAETRAVDRDRMAVLGLMSGAL